MLRVWIVCAIGICGMSAGPPSRNRFGEAGPLARNRVAEASQARRNSMTADPGPGVTMSLAEDRARRVGNLRYELHFTIPSNPATLVEGRVTIRFTMTDPTRPLALDFSGPGPVRARSGGRDISLAAEPLPTYLFAFAAGRFKIETAERNGRRLRMFHRETDAAKVARNREAVFDLHAAALEWLERYTGIAYPFGKFDFLLVPSFQFGGMEHAGAIFYNASGLLLDESATQNQKLGRASVIAHETAHMWFGDLVTMRWFNDVWTKEVFANFMAAKIVNPSFPGINHDLRFLWVDEAGRPDISPELRIENGAIAGLAFTQKDPAPRRGLVWTERMEVALGYDTNVRAVPVSLNAPRVDVAAARGLPTPRFILPTGGGIAYGGFAIDAATREYLLHHLADIPDALTRGSALVTLWEDMLEGRSGPAAVLDELIVAVPREVDELNLQRMLSYTQQAFWRFLSAPARGALAPRLERVLREGLDAAGAPSVKSAWFSAIRDVGHTPATLDWLERVWRKTESVPGLVLAEPDYIQLAQELAVRGVPAWRAILDGEFARIENPDRKARFAFVRPSLSPDQSVRDAFFQSLRDVQNRRREPWVVEGVSYLHHPLRAETSRKYIPASLAMLEEIQRTGDIFFPKRWMDATLSGHSSASAARMVRTFLAGLPPNYPDRLRRITLSSADELFRAAR